MDADALLQVLQQVLPGVRFESTRSFDAHPTFFIDRPDVPEVMRQLRSHPDLRFTLLAELTAVDFWPREPRFEVVYTLVSIELRHRVRIKVALHGGDAHVADVSGIWPAANWLEREVWDLFGIEFDGHPDLRRLLMPEDWDGFPLRKDYPVQVKMPARIAEPLQITEQEFRANVMRDRRARGD